MDDFTQARLLQIECTMNGMIAENKQRELTGDAMAYGAQDFQDLRDEIQSLINGRIR